MYRYVTETTVAFPGPLPHPGTRSGTAARRHPDETLDSQAVTRPHEADRLAELFERHADRLFRLAARLVGEREEARDLVQETFLRVARRPSRIPVQPAGAEAWLVRTLVNLCRDRGRRLRVRERWRFRQQAERVDPGHAAMGVERLDLDAAVRLLSPLRRAAILLCELEGYTPTEAARLLGVPPPTLRWHLAIARRRLRKALAPEPARSGSGDTPAEGEEP